MEINLIAESLKFLVLGMSTVFMFLILMVIVLNIQAKIVMKFFPPKEKEVIASSHSLVKKDNLAVIVAIAASLQSYKKSKQ